MKVLMGTKQMTDIYEGMINGHQTQEGDTMNKISQNHDTKEENW